MYLEIDEGYWEHRKTLRLRSLLQVPEADAYPPRLWAWAMRNAPDGNLTGMTAYGVELAARYGPLDGKLYAALVTAGFIDEVEPGVPAKIHDWEDHTGAALERASVQAQRRRLYGSDWSVVRRRILDRDGWRCRGCGSGGGLDVHHRRPLRTFEVAADGNRESNLVTLCRTCHQTAELRFRLKGEVFPLDDEENG